CSNNCTSIYKTDSKDKAACGKNSCTSRCSSCAFVDTSITDKLLPSCKLTSKEQAERAELLKTSLFKKAKSITELKDGYDFVFQEPIEFSNQLMEVVNFERVCCPYFTWGLLFEPQNKAAHLQIYGSAEIKEELRIGLKEMGLM